MKKLLLVLFLACGTTALANTTDPIQEKKTVAAQHAAKVAAKVEETNQEVIKQENAKNKNPHVIADNSRYGIGAYIVEFINRSNIKIMRKLLID